MTALNYADRLFYNNRLVDRVYAGSTLVWPTWKPTNLSGCAIWIDISQSPNITNGGDVTFLYNRGSGPAPVMWGNPPNPKFRTNALNTSMPVMTMRRGQGRFRFSGTGVDKNWTLIYVARRWQLTGGRIITAASTASNTLVGFHGNEMDMCYTEGWITPSTAPFASTQWKLYSADATSSSPSRFFSNGVLLATGSVTPSLGWGGTLNISGYQDTADATTNQECDCEIAELVMYNRKLSDAERQQVENYLRTKWNPITLFTPTDYGSNLVAWFDGADTATVQMVGAGVNAWVNKGVGGMTLNQPTAANRPTYASNAVKFAQTQIMNPANGPASFDFFVVSKPNASGDWRTLLRSAQGHEMILEATSTKFGVYTTNGFNQAGSYIWPTIQGIGFSRVAASAVTMMSRDGLGLLSTTTALPVGSPAPTMFGGYASAPPSQPWGDVNEVVFLPYNTDGARQLMEGYLAWKWGIAGLMPPTHPYKNAPP